MGREVADAGLGPLGVRLCFLAMPMLIRVSGSLHCVLDRRVFRYVELVYHQFIQVCALQCSVWIIHHCRKAGQFLLLAECLMGDLESPRPCCAVC